MKRGDYFYLVTRQGTEYTVHQYQVSDKKIVEPSEVSVIEQNIVGHQATLVTCYPIGSFEQRYIVQ
jgi:LPXTG-site transpeptidase (sortase) family protein